MKHQIQRVRSVLVRPLAGFIERRLPFVSYRLQAALSVGGAVDAEHQVNLTDWWESVLTLSAGLWLCCSAIGMVMNDGIWFWIGLLAAAGYPVIRYRSAIERWTRYQEQITYDLPEFVQLVVIYLYAGLTVSAAIRSTADRWKKRSGPLPELLRDAARQLSLQTPLVQVLHQLTVRADTNDVKTVVTILLTHTIRGGDAIFDTLLDITRQMWLKKLSLVRKRAQETTVKLIFPLILIFAAILGVIGAPAVLFMSS